MHSSQVLAVRDNRKGRGLSRAFKIQQEFSEPMRGGKSFPDTGSGKRKKRSVTTPGPALPHTWGGHAWHRWDPSPVNGSGSGP